MISHVNTFLGFDGGCIPKGECLVIGQNEEKGSFLLHQVVSAAVKEKRPVCLVSFVQKLHHYHGVSQKIGVNLKSAVQAKQLQFIDLSEDLVQTFFPAADDGQVAQPLNFLETARAKLLKALLNLSEDTGSEPVLVIDEPSVLLSVGFGVDEVKMYLKSLLQNQLDLSQDAGLQHGTSVVVLTSYNEHDKSATSLWQFLRGLGTVDVSVRGLQTGYCKDVHGQMSVTWRDGLDKPRRHSTKTAQFKLLESGVQIFASGTSSAVL